MAEMNFAKFYDVFASSARNQQVFDRYYYKLLGLNFSAFWGVPRPSKWAKRHFALLSVMRIFAPIISVLWCYFFAYLFIFAKFFFLFLKLRDVHFSEAGKTVALAICDRSCIVLSRELKVSSLEREVIWLVPDGVSLSAATLKNLSSTPVLASSVLSRSEIFEAFVFSLKAHALLVSQLGTRLGMQSYILPNWAIFNFSLVKLSPSLIATAEHHDRWAVAADFYCAEMDVGVSGAGIMLVQHGLEHAETYRAIADLTGNVGLPYRLKFVRQLYLYNLDQSIIFFDHIISDLVDRQCVVLKRISSSMLLSSVSADRTSILFVGHPICEDFHMAVLAELAGRYDLNFFYKPHPAAKESAKVRDADWKVITDASFFPAVNFIISYPSTLVAEYDFYNIPAVVHAIDASNAEVKQVVNSIQVMVDSAAV